MYDTTLLATDGSSDAEAAVEHAITLATTADTTLHIVSVVETRTAYDNAIIDPEEVRENLRADARDAVAAAQSTASAAGIDCETTVTEGSPPAEILSVADDIEAEGIVVGATGRSGFKRLVLGGTAEQLLESATIPVIVVGGER